MNYLYHCLTRIIIFITLLSGAIAALYPAIRRAFVHNIPLNSFIAATLVFGILWVIWQLVKLIKEQKWIDTLIENKEISTVPHILAPLSNLLESAKQGSINQFSLKMVLSSIEQRLDESRVVSRYMIGVLIFLGLLGTFWGLSQTIGAIAGVIAGIDIQASEAKEAFNTLKQGLQSPLKGMGTAFSSSMFGLIGSLVVGFLDLQYSRAASAFYNKIEEKMIYYNKPSGFYEENVGNAYSQGLLEQTIEGMSSLSQQMKASEENRLSLLKGLNMFNEKLVQLAEHVNGSQTIIKKIAQNQLEMQEVIAKILKPNNQHEEILRQHLRSLDQTTTKLLEESVEGRNKVIGELRNEIRVIARTLSALASQEAA